MRNRPFDLHAHSGFSDGTVTPERIVNEAKEKGLELVALTDHDTVEGVSRAMEEGRRIGQRVIPALEMDTDFTAVLHILGYGIDIHNGELGETLRKAQCDRAKRNERIVDALYGMGMDIRGCLDKTEGVSTRLNIAVALRDAGYVSSVAEAIERYLKKGMPAFVACEHVLPREAIAIIHRAGGFAVLAHPHKIRADVPSLVQSLAADGLDGIEAYYPGTTPGERRLYLTLARQYGLMVTCGSDYHGSNRSGVELGCAYEPVPALEATLERLLERIAAQTDKP
ncbi:MAG: PHP domain-containing protein [Bacillota bacterium]